MKSKIAKKLLATSVAAAMTIGLVGCGGETDVVENQTPNTTPDNGSAATTPDNGEATTTPDSGETTTTPDEDEVSEVTILTDENGNVYDLGGAEIIIGDWWSTDPDPEAEKTAYQEASEEYIDFIQSTYNFKIKREKVGGWGDVQSNFQNYQTTGGDDKNYLFTLWFGPSLASYLEAGMLYNISSLDCIDFTKAKFVNGVHNLISKGTDSYAMSAEAPEPREGIFFNYDLIEEAGYTADELYELQESGQWTWDKFIEVCDKITRDTDGDGINDVFAFTAQRERIFEAAVYSNGGSFIDKRDGKFVIAATEQNTTDAMNWVLEELLKYEYPQPEGSTWEYFKSAFVESKAAFGIDQAYMSEGGQPWNEVDFEYGFLCFPKGPQMDDYTNMYNDNVFVIPACYDADRAWKIAFAYDLYTDPVPGYEDYEGWRLRFENSTFGNEESGKAIDLTLARMTKNGGVTYHNMVPGISLASDVMWGLVNNNWAEKLDAKLGSWQSKVDAQNNK